MKQCRRVFQCHLLKQKDFYYFHKIFLSQQLLSSSNACSVHPHLEHKCNQHVTTNATFFNGSGTLSFIRRLHLTTTTLDRKPFPLLFFIASATTHVSLIKSNFNIYLFIIVTPSDSSQKSNFINIDNSSLITLHFVASKNSLILISMH